MQPRVPIFKTSVILLLFLAFSYNVYGEPNDAPVNGGSIAGFVLDHETKKPVEFANVILFSKNDSAEVTGAVTDGSGKFTMTGVKAGSYFLQIQIIGYGIKVVRNVLLSDSRARVNLGRIYLEPTAIQLPDVVSEARRSGITYEPGKQVINVSRMRTALSGTAADVLQNVPSVNVDINGNVTLRGSSNFQVLVNGRPSVMSAQNALQQIPASSIKNIQIITNPSAKYDASGAAGIINIILKKNADMGLSGIMNLMGGLGDKYAGNFTLQYKTHAVSYDVGADFNRRSFPGTDRQEKEFIVGNNTSYLNSNGDVLWQRILSGVRGGIDFNLSPKDNLSISGRYGGRSFHHYSSLSTDQYSNLQSQLYYLDNHDYNHYGSFYEASTNYIHNFNANGDRLTGYLSFRHHSSDAAAISDAMQSGNTLNGTQTTELGPHNELRGNLDYKLPIGKSEQFWAGSEFFTRTYQDINRLYSFDSSSGSYNFQPRFSHTNNFDRARFAAYSMFADRWDSLQVQIGFRTEYTYQLVAQADSNSRFAFSRWDYFPSISSSYDFGNGIQAMASYSRRIERPNGGDLEPFYSWFDANTVHIGNPNLKPELIDSYEAGFQTFLGNVSISNDIYYRFTQDKIEHINSVYAPNVTLVSVANVGNDYALGYEFSLQLNPVKIWRMNLMGNLYNYRISGAIDNQSFARQSFDWGIKDNNSLSLTRTTEVQLNARYHSPSVTAQGTWGGFFTTDLAVKQDIIHKSLSLTLDVGDLLNTGRREFTTQGVGFYNHNFYFREGPVVMLNLQYTFNNFKTPTGLGGKGEQDK